MLRDESACERDSLAKIVRLAKRQLQEPLGEDVICRVSANDCGQSPRRVRASACVPLPVWDRLR